MICFFHRAEGVIRCEVRHDRSGNGYELVIDRPDSMVRVERFGRAEALNKRWRDIERTLLMQGWRGPGLRPQCPAR
jgi:hypothetical protein